jgi:hypothetical protein
LLRHVIMICVVTVAGSSSQFYDVGRVAGLVLPRGKDFYDLSSDACSQPEIR